MEKLDLAKINNCAPYAVKEDSQEGAYTFIAESGAGFSVGFMPDDLILSDQLMRGRLFKNWFDTYEYRNRFTMVISTLVDEYGMDNVASVIIRNSKSVPLTSLRLKAWGGKFCPRPLPHGHEIK